MYPASSASMSNSMKNSSADILFCCMLLSLAYALCFVFEGLKMLSAISQNSIHVILVNVVTASVVAVAGVMTLWPKVPASM